jgi:hypothetical protein
MMHPSQTFQPSLFDEDAPSVSLPPPQRSELAARVEALLREIATTLANREAGDDQDHG